MKRYILLFLLLLTGLAFGATGSIAITSPAASLVDCTVIDNETDYKNYNFGASPYIAVALWEAGVPQVTLLRFNTLADSMRHVVASDAGTAVTWDSAIVTFTLRNSGFLDLAANETTFVAFYKLRRAFGEGTVSADYGGAGLGCSYLRADSTAGARVLWGTAGCLNTSNDRYATKETIASRSIDTRLVYGQTTGTITVPISGATVTDTLGGTVAGGLGVVLDVVRTAPSNNTFYHEFASDDLAIASGRPAITAYWTTAAAGTTPKGKRRKLQQGLGVIDTNTNVCQYEEKER